MLSIADCVARYERVQDQDAIRNLGLMSEIAAAWDDFGKTRRIYPFNSYLKLLKEGGKEPSRVPLEDAVQIMTIHQAKGLEFPVVVLGSAMKGRLPTCRHNDPYDIPYHLRASGEPEVADCCQLHLMDERKLFYVAATRARDLLIVGTADVVNKRGGGPSPFVMEMFGSDLHQAADQRKPLDGNVPSCKKGPVGPRPRHSFSQLAYFLQCPWRYKLATVYGFQVLWQDSVGYGANVHRALEEIHRRAAEGHSPTAEDIPSIVSQTWVSNHKTKPAQEKKFMAAATKRLRKYVNEHSSKLPKTIDAEIPFSFILSDEVMLGKIDLIRGTYSDGIEIVDFKTSAAKPLAEDGMDLQLDLYALGAKESLRHNVARTAVHFLDDGKVSDSLWSEERRAKAVSRLGHVLESINRGDFQPTREFCGQCDEFKKICPYSVSQE